MRFIKVSIQNFRSIGNEVTINVPAQHLVLVGANNAGKSNIISAIDWVLGSRSPFQLRAAEEDFHNPSLPIVIEATLGDIKPVEKSILMGFATNQKQRGALAGNADPLIVLTLTIPPAQGDESDDDESEEGEGAVTRPTLGVKLWGFPVYRKQADIRRALVQLLRVGPERNVGDDLQASRWTPYGQLMKQVMEGSAEFPDLVALLTQVNDKIQDIFTGEKDALLANAQVVSYVEDISFQLTRDNNPVELLRYLEVLVREDGYQTNIANMGTGTQSAVIIGMLELALRRRSSRIKVFAVEEPDAFLHPHGVRHLANLIKRIGEDVGSQVVLTTHSPALLAGLKPADIVRVEKRSGTTAVYQAVGSLSDPAFARLIDSETAEMFFARRVVLVEGDTERFLFPPVARLVEADGSLDFDRQHISVVSMDGKDNVVNYLKILDEFKIEAIAVLDNDFLGGSTCRALVTYLRGKGQTIDDSTDATLRSGLRTCGVIVLSNGEIEDYIPAADVATMVGKTETEVQQALARAAKASDEFKLLFRASKPVYGRQIADFYLQGNQIPGDIERLVRRLAS